MPPIMHLLEVDVSGPKNSLDFSRTLFNSSRITPGCTLTQCSSVLISSIEVICLETSTTRPEPTTWPASEVPAVRGMSGILFSAAKRMSFLMSSLCRGLATPRGISLNAEASVAYMSFQASSVNNSPSSSGLRASSFSSTPVVKLIASF